MRMTITISLDVAALVAANQDVETFTRKDLKWMVEDHSIAEAILRVGWKAREKGDLTDERAFMEVVNVEPDDEAKQQIQDDIDAREDL